MTAKEEKWQESEEGNAEYPRERPISNGRNERIRANQIKVIDHTDTATGQKYGNHGDGKSSKYSHYQPPHANGSRAQRSPLDMTVVPHQKRKKAGTPLPPEDIRVLL